MIKGRGKKFEVDLHKDVQEIAGPEPTGEAVAYSVALDGRKLAVCTAKGGVHVCVVPSGWACPEIVEEPGSPFAPHVPMYVWWMKIN